MKKIPSVRDMMNQVVRTIWALAAVAAVCSIGGGCEPRPASVGDTMPVGQQSELQVFGFDNYEVAIRPIGRTVVGDDDVLMVLVFPGLEFRMEEREAAGVKDEPGTYKVQGPRWARSGQLLTAEAVVAALVVDVLSKGELEQPGLVVQGDRAAFDEVVGVGEEVEFEVFLQAIGAFEGTIRKSGSNWG